MKKLVPIVLALFLIAGCSTAAPAGESDPPGGPSEPDTSAPATPGSCDVETERAMDQVVGSQIDALRTGDFAGAYDLAAPAFQLSVSLEVFELVIQEGYRSLLEARSHTLSDCVLFPQDLGNTVVTVRTVSGGVFTYYYEMINTDQGWRILGASEIAPVSSGT